MSNSTLVNENLKPKPTSLVRGSNDFQKESGAQSKENLLGNSKDFIGVLEVVIHQARDINNICIYHNQDVYAMVYLTSDPETTVSSQIINGGGTNPVFNQSFMLNVQTIESSLKCEIWMLSRIKNYLQDQLLGFVAVPIPNVVAENGRLAREFELSSSDLFHAPAGFLELTLMYKGAVPEVLELPASLSSLAVKIARKEDSCIPSTLPCEFGKIEFPDPKIVNENEIMVSEYVRIPCSTLDSKSPGNLDTSDDNNSQVSVEKTEALKVEIPPISRISPLGFDSPGALGSHNEADWSLKKKESIGDTEEKVVQQEIADMYMKSMRQFTESLANMKLPLDIGAGSANLGSSGLNGKIQASKSSGPNQRVFYGSRAFF